MSKRRVRDEDIQEAIFYKLRRHTFLTSSGSIEEVTIMMQLLWQARRMRREVGENGS